MKALFQNGIGVALLFTTASAFAQVDLSKYEIGITGGVFIYQGDLTPSNIGSYRTPSINLNLFVNRILNNSFSLRTNLAFGKLRGNDAAYSQPAWRKQRAFNFNSSVVEVSQLLIWNKWGNDRKFNPYLFAGVGLSFVNIKRDWSGFNEEYFSNEDIQARLTKDAAHGLPKLVPVVPVGVGVRYSLTQKLSLIGETNYRLTRTDYLDGFSKAANPSLKDHYQSHTIGVVYQFGKKSMLDCPVLVQ